MKRAYVGESFHRLLHYVVQYRKMRGRANATLIMEQLILAYAKQLASAMPEPVWRANIITLINECESEHQERFNHELEKHKRLERKASQS